MVVDGHEYINCAMAGPVEVIRHCEAPTVKLDKAVAFKSDNCIDHQREGRIPACYVKILLHALPPVSPMAGGGSMIVPELSDVLFGTPEPIQSPVNLGY
jgi:hypothetical protein